MATSTKGRDHKNLLRVLRGFVIFATKAVGPSHRTPAAETHMPDTALPSWAGEMRDLFRSGSAAQFLLHGNVFDVVPLAGKLLSVPAFLEQAMFGTYDVVLRYDRSRGVRATRGADDWGEWLQNALGREAATQTLTREPGSALELTCRSS